jgi:glycosyltransferase involved in cell wall biosynthesis
VTHNQLDYTKLCVDSVERHTREPYELIVVDNGSTDGTVEWVKGIGETIEDRGSRMEDREPEQRSEIRGQESDGSRPVRVTVIANVDNRKFRRRRIRGFEQRADNRSFCSITIPL